MNMPARLTLLDLNHALALRGEDLGASTWLTVSQAMIDSFAETTGDRQWIHVDPSRAAQGPFGATIAHGMLTLSLAATFVPQIVEFEGFTSIINYGLNRVRFLTPVRVNSRLRGRLTIDEVKDARGGFDLATTVTVEIDGADTPACVAQLIIRCLH